MIGERQTFPCDLPGSIPVQLLYINEDPHQFRNGNGRVGIIQLNRHEIAEIFYFLIQILKSAENILKGGADKEELLFESQFLT